MPAESPRLGVRIARRFSFVARSRPPRGRCGTIALLLPFVLAPFAPAALAQASAATQARITAIAKLSAEEMASSSLFIRRAYDAQLAHVARIQDPRLRAIVLDFMLRPNASAFGEAATQSWLASPGSGWKSHHAYPGGLSVHNLEWVEVASGWVDTYEKVYGVTLNRDLVVAGLLLHDWGKVWFVFDDATGRIREPEWYPKAWGTQAKWKWMGGHGNVLYAELIHRGAPQELLFASASAHFDPYWNLDKDGEGLNPALREAAAVVKKPAPAMKPDQRMAEMWIPTFVDEAWSFSTMVAAKFAFDLLAGIARELGLEPDSREANKLAWFVLSRVGDFRIYEVYQKAGFDPEAAKRFVRSVIEDPSPYEVPGTAALRAETTEAWPLP
jgi:hypothetical protein